MARQRAAELPESNRASVHAILPAYEADYAAEILESLVTSRRRLVVIDPAIAARSATIGRADGTLDETRTARECI